MYRFHSAELSGQLTFTQLFELPSEGHSEAKSRKLIWLKENKQKNNKHSISPKCSTVYIWILDLSVCCPDLFLYLRVRATQCIDKEILISKNGNIGIDIEIDKRMF